MKKDHVLVPEPTSKFNKVKCHECDEEQIVYSHSTTQVICNSCGNILSKATFSDKELKILHGIVTSLKNFKINN